MLKEEIQTSIKLQLLGFSRVSNRRAKPYMTCHHGSYHILKSGYKVWNLLLNWINLSHTITLKHSLHLNSTLEWLWNLWAWKEQMYPLKKTGTAKLFILQLRGKPSTSAVHSHCFFEANKLQNLPCCSIKPHWGVWQS